MLPLRILVAPSGFKESLGPDDVASCIEDGIKKATKDTSVFVRKVPLHDGGEGFCRALVSNFGGYIRTTKVTGPTRDTIESHYGIIEQHDKKVAVMDMAAAAGLSLVPKELRDPTVTTTYGVGQLIAEALDEDCQKIIIGCGDSGTSDGGAGMLQALGVRLLDEKDCELPPAAGGGSLVNLRKICMANIHPRLQQNSNDVAVPIEAVCNIKNVLCGRQGVARIYGPQKGATPDQVEVLSTAMNRLADAAKPILGRDISTAPGAGASGGLGAGLLLLNSNLRARVNAIDDYFHLRQVFETPWDIVFTAEGSLDSQSAKGKMTVEVARRASQHGCSQVVALAGTIQDGAESVYDEGIAAFASIQDSPVTLEDAIEHTPSLLTNAAERTMRMLKVGRDLGHKEHIRLEENTAPISWCQEEDIKEEEPQLVTVTNVAAH